MLRVGPNYAVVLLKSGAKSDGRSQSWSVDHPDLRAIPVVFVVVLGPLLLIVMSQSGH